MEILYTGKNKLDICFLGGVNYPNETYEVKKIQNLEK